ncbi:hypothetical protein AB6A40_008913 [Gnathostoma spinigerum]|uniref:Uncharacterized protein n=1 Tax=Gnathostoma spinigerum TaxID=75299 RepID=A0ABD6EY78_9BILA
MPNAESKTSHSSNEGSDKGDKAAMMKNDSERSQTANDEELPDTSSSEQPKKVDKASGTQKSAVENRKRPSKKVGKKQNVG